MAAVRHPTGTHVPEFVTIALDTDFIPPLRGIRCAAAGDVEVVSTAGETIVIASVLAGETIRGGIQMIVSANTTVDSPTTNIVGLR